jgi:Calcineurin-like phosphoesterase
MNRQAILIRFSPIVFLLVLACAQQPVDTGDWQVEIGPAGNEFSELHDSQSEPEGPPAPEQLYTIVRALTPANMEIDEGRLRYDGTYWIRAQADSNRYDYHLTFAGGIIEIVYKNVSSGLREKAYALVHRGTKRVVSLDDVPPQALATLAEVIPDTMATKAWIATTGAGPRYVIVVGGSVFYARADGQIQSARRICEGGLEENYPKDGDREQITSEIMAEAAESLCDFRDRFDYANQIERLEIKDNGAEAPFRFVVMGDSRSNETLWPIILEHIAALDPPPEFVINTGDIVIKGFVDEFRDYFIPPLLDIDYPYFTALGNHDCGFEGLAMEYRYLFGENSLNFYYDYGAYRFIFLDSATKLNTMETSIAWLDDLLANTPKDRHLVVFTHKPFKNIDKWAYHSLSLDHSEAITALMTEHEVSHVFLGHIHAYSTATLDGVDYTISGGGGAGLHDRFGEDGNVHHYIIVDAEPDGTLKQQVVRFRKKKEPTP